MDGVYSTKIKTPMGMINGKLTLKTNGKILTGIIEAMGMQSDFSNGTINGNSCNFSGVIKSMMGNISYDASGVVNGNKINVIAKTNMGNFEFVGEK